MRIGYARCSTAEQRLDLQTDALKAAGCERIYSEQASGAGRERPQLARMMDALREGDTLVVYKLDRLGRSVQQLVETVERLRDMNVGFESLTEKIDTGTAGGMMVFTVFAAIAQFERDLIRERTRDGLAAARRRGSRCGRPPRLTDTQVEELKRLHDEGALSIRQLCELFHISRTTLYRHLRSGEA